MMSASRAAPEQGQHDDTRRPAAPLGRTGVPQPTAADRPGTSVLERSAGNAVLARSAAGGTRPADPLPTIWRCGPVPCDCSAEERAAAAGVAVSNPADPAEREAERVAAAVTSDPSTGA
jgi:hypothetical protein